MNTLLYVIKYCAAVVAGVYGIYATVTDFHKENENGEKVLTTKGRAGIALLVLSTVLSLSSDTIKDTRESSQAKADEAKREELLTEARRASSPFSPDRIVGGLSTSLPIRGELVNSYLHRVERLTNHSNTSDIIRQHAPGFPQEYNRQEEELFWLATNTSATVIIFKASPGSRVMPDLSLTLVCSYRTKQKLPQIDMNILWQQSIHGLADQQAGHRQVRELNVQCETEDIFILYNSGNVRSFLDFAGATIQVIVSNGPITDNSVPKYVTLKTNEGRQIRFENFTHSATCKNSCFTTTMPLDFK
jgi:hypothetical protein